MKNFNYSRFKNFGNYDLIINKSFYRNMALTTLFGCIGIAVIGFTLRWNMCRDYLVPNEGYILSDYINPENVKGTAGCILAFCLLMMIIFAGFTFHNLCTKQGRITELTIPATNLERWSWHVLLSFLGGLLLCISGILLSDVLNAVLNLLVYQGHFSSSLTARICSFITFDHQHIDPPSVRVNGTNVKFVDDGMGYLMTLSYCTFIYTISCYVLGNSIKYRYNIILTYITLQVLGTIVSIVIMIFGATVVETFGLNFEVTESTAKCMLIGLCVVILIITALFYWGSYHNYCKAQITSHMNK